MFLFLERFAVYPAYLHLGIYILLIFHVIFCALLHPYVGIQRRVSVVEIVARLRCVDYLM